MTTTTYQRIEDLTPAEWAALTRRAAQTAAAAAEDVGLAPSADVAAVAAMSEEQLIDHRNTHGPGQRRLSAVMRLVQADQLRANAEHLALTAQQDRTDAAAKAEMADAEAARAVQEAALARERAREVEAESARKDQRRAADHAADQRTIEALRSELAQLRADAQAEIAAAREQAAAADARAEQRAAERAAERKDAEAAIQRLHEQIEKISADTAAQLAAAAEQVRAAEARAAQRTTERTTEREAAERDAQEARSSLERVRADAAAAVAEAKGKAAGEIADARKVSDAAVAQAQQEAEAAVAEAHQKAAAEIAAAGEEIAAARHEAAEEIARVRAVADEEVARAHQAAQEAVDWAKGEVQRIGAGHPGTPQAPWENNDDFLPPPVTIPVPPREIRDDTGPIEDTLAVIRRVDELCWQLKQNTGPGGVRHPVRSEHARGLLRAVQQQAGDFSQQLHSLGARYEEPWQTRLARDYARSAAEAYSGFLQRIAAATDRLGQSAASADADVVTMISQMLDQHPWVSR